MSHTPVPPLTVNPPPPEGPLPTPINQGTGSDSGFARLHKQKDHLPHLMADLHHERTLAFREFLKHIFNIDPTWKANRKCEIDAFRKGDQFKKHLADYEKGGEKYEHGRYQPLVRLLNHIAAWVLEHNPNGPNIAFARNDPTIIRGSAAERKPDIIGGVASVFTHESPHAKGMAKKDPSDFAPQWSGISIWVELKRRLHLLGDSAIPSPAPPLPTRRAGESVPTATRPPLRNNTVTARDSRSIMSTSDFPGYKVKRGAYSEADAGPAVVVSWMTDIELKETPESQCASYALETLSHGGLRTHAIGALVSDGSIEILYYDRSIILKSEPFNFLSDDGQADLIMWVAGMVGLDSAGWGFDPILPRVYRDDDVKTTCTISRSLYNDSLMELQPGWKLRIENTLFSAHCIIGRATTVFLAEVEGAPDGKTQKWLKKRVVIKLSNPAETRCSEVEIVKDARRYAKKTGMDKILKHLPKIIFHEDREPGHTQQTLFDCLDEYERRVPRTMVLEELFPVTRLTNATIVADVYRGIFDCYEWLYTEREILHGDISLNNLMYRVDGGGTHHGVLNDFDLARRGPPTGPQSNQKTGTKQFMSIDLLHPRKSYLHLYRHDLESLFYVILFHLSKYNEGCEDSVPQLDQWLEIPQAQLYYAKTDFFGDLDWEDRLPPVQRNFTPLAVWVTQLYWMLRMGFLARAASVVSLGCEGEPTPPFDNATLGGYVTFAKFRKILNRFGTTGGAQ